MSQHFEHLVEKLDDWELLDSLSLDESAPSTKQAAADMIGIRRQSVDAASSTQFTPETHSGRQSSIPDDYTGELYPCMQCNSYHYTHNCIYLLSWEDWLEYHAKHMFSQPSRYTAQSRSPEECMGLPAWEEIREMDDNDSETEMPAYLGEQGLRADLMSMSSRVIFEEDEGWQARLDKRGMGDQRIFLPQNIEAQQMLAWQLDLDGDGCDDLAEF